MRASVRFDFTSESSDEETHGARQDGQRQNVPLAPTLRRTFAISVTLLAIAAAVFFWHGSHSISKASDGFVSRFDEEVVDADPGHEHSCEQLQLVHLDSVVSSNLGKKGPDTEAEEGIIYNASLRHPLLNHTRFQIHIHSVLQWSNSTQYDDQYSPQWTKGDFVNGKHGKFFHINVKPNSSVKLRVHAHQLGSVDDLQVPVAHMTFFDLDTGRNNNHSIEQVKICDIQRYYLSNATEINTTLESDGGHECTVFTATVEGTGDDNPKDPDALTVQQKNKAVTVELRHANAINFEVGASPGETGRVFSFVLRPSLLCADTKLANGSLVPAEGRGAPIEIVKGGCEDGCEESVVKMAHGGGHKALPGSLFAMVLVWFLG